MEYLRRYMFIPGKVENIVVFVDLKNLGIADVPIKALKSIYSVLSHHYIVRVFRFYIVNMSYMLSTLVGVVKPILTDRQRQKLNFLKNVSECREWVALHHLEEDLGGTRPKITQFFPFPLLPGPFKGGYSDGARTDAVPNCHKALTPEGFRGHLWDASKQWSENTQYEYTSDAEEIFNSCALPIPPGCPVKPKEELKLPPIAENGDGAQANKLVISLDDSTPVQAKNNDLNVEAEASATQEEPPVVINDSEMDMNDSMKARGGSERTSEMVTPVNTEQGLNSMAVQAGDVRLQEEEKPKPKCGGKCCVVM
jgi:hypothetical protein